MKSIGDYLESADKKDPLYREGKLEGVRRLLQATDFSVDIIAFLMGVSVKLVAQTKEEIKNIRIKKDPEKALASVKTLINHTDFSDELIAFVVSVSTKLVAKTRKKLAKKQRLQAETGSEVA